MIKDGGSAFPLMPPCDQYGQQPPGWPYPENGMTLRDWFAGQALNAIITDTLSPRDCEFGDGTSPRDRIAERCYAIADAMLAAREADNG